MLHVSYSLYSNLPTVPCLPHRMSVVRTLTVNFPSIFPTALYHKRLVFELITNDFRILPPLGGA